MFRENSVKNERKETELYKIEFIFCIFKVLKMQKIIVHGVPFLVDKLNNLYSFEQDKKNLIILGTYNPEKETYTLKDNWEELYQEKLDDYRKNLKNRERKDNKVELK